AGDTQTLVAIGSGCRAYDPRVAHDPGVVRQLRFEQFDPIRIAAAAGDDADQPEPAANGRLHLSRSRASSRAKPSGSPFRYLLAARAASRSRPRRRSVRNRSTRALSATGESG